MTPLEDIKNIFIDFDIVLNSDLDALKSEWALLIAAGKLIFVWGRQHSPAHMKRWCKENGLYDYVWNYEFKDSSIYSKVDFIIDSDAKLVERFRNKGIPGNVIGAIK